VDSERSEAGRGGFILSALPIVLHADYGIVACGVAVGAHMSYMNVKILAHQVM
jgi:hypothetical protein